jgi:uncharacterized protein
VNPLPTYATEAAPRVRQFHLFDGGSGPHVLVSNGSRIYAIGPEVERALASAAGLQDEDLADELLSRFGLEAPEYVGDAPPADPPTRSLSLAIAQKCNLGCTYCYAQQGDFGATPKMMSPEVALRAAESLIARASAGDRVNLAFLGGEPLVNRPTLQATTERASTLARDNGVQIGFSITTNGTLLREEDIEFFERHGFAVTVSLDGVGDVHDQLRPFKSGRPSYNRVMENVVPLLSAKVRMKVAARATVTPRNLRLVETLNKFIRLGFDSVGFSPMLSSPTGADELSVEGLESMLEQMICCAEEFERRVIDGEHYPFLNVMNALKEIHRGTHRPYPCGAGAGYFGVSAEGELFACHRFVGDDQTAMGDLTRGVDRDRQRKWLENRHVHAQEPCRSCWARYLCGGGCHHEVVRRGRVACDYIRGWLHHCLQTYVRLSERCPDYLESLG